MLYVVAGTYYRYLGIIKKFNLESLSVKYANGLHTLSNATEKDFYLVSGLVTDRKDYQDIMDKIKSLDLQPYEVEK